MKDYKQEFSVLAYKGTLSMVLWRCLLFKGVTIIWVIVLGNVLTASVPMAQMDCSKLDPRASVSSEIEGKIAGSVNTLYKIAKAGGSIQGKLKDDIHNLQMNANITDHTLIKLRTLYIFCGMVANADDLSTERKVKLFTEMMTVKDSDKPKSIRLPKKKKAARSSNVTALPKNDERGLMPLQGTSQPNPQPNVNVNSHGQSGGFTAQNVTQNITVNETPRLQDIACNRASSPHDCPLEIGAYGYDLPHPTGSNVDGIIWKADIYSDVRVTLKNRQLARIENISLTLQPETSITEAVQATNNPGVSISHANIGGIQVQEMAVTIEDKNGILWSIPAPTGGREFIAPLVKLQASELLANGEMKIVMACVALNPMVNDQWPKTLIAPRRPPKWIRIYGTYETAEAGSQKRCHFKAEFSLADKLAR